jgi:transitional endoplasmic reticulum ATPase
MSSLPPVLRSCLSPVQAIAAHSVLEALKRSPIVALWGGKGCGKSTTLSAIQQTCGGSLIRAREIVESEAGRHPLALEECFYRCVRAALDQADTVLVDDLDQTTGVFSGCGFYPRSGWFEAPALALAMHAIDSGKRIVLAGSGRLPESMRTRSEFVKIRGFRADDYAHLCRSWLLPEQHEAIQIDKLFRFAPKLNGHQLRQACTWLRSTGGPTSTDSFIDYLRSQRLVSNVSLDAVAPVELRSLRGIDDVIEALETHVVLPLEQDELVSRYSLRPKRGVLLAGPPGTGKTTVGRALARRLKGKFLSIDGTVISGTREFYGQINHLFETAQANAPAVIFIDDGDVLFENKENAGLYRYLLTKLDGLESEDSGRVCVMLTAMDVGSLPPALVRSGRIELWLQMRLPDAAARGEILRDLLAGQESLLGVVALDQVVSETDGFTGADLKRTVEDSKLLLAADVAKRAPRLEITEYLKRAARAARSNKELYAAAVDRSRAAACASPPWMPLPDDGFPDDD